MSIQRRVVVTGLGPICSLGIGKKEVWINLKNQKTGLSIKEFSLGGELLDRYYQYQAPTINLNDYFNEYKLYELQKWKKGQQDEDLNFILAAISIALNDSGLRISRNCETQDIGLVVSHENPGLEQLLTNFISNSFNLLSNKSLEFSEYFRKIYYLLERSAYETQSFMFLHHISRVHNIHGRSLIINNACSSGLYAIEAGSQIIKSGASNIMIIAASDVPQFYKYLWLKEQGLYSEKGMINPFSKDSDGFIFGEGASALILEEYEHAKKRDAQIYAEYLGGGFSQDAWKVTLPAVKERYYSSAIEAALNSSGVKKNNINLINAHGLSTKIGDLHESRALNDVFGKSMPYVTAFKPYVGHNLGGSALIETLLLILALNQGFAPPILNIENFDESLSLNIVKDYIELQKNCNALKISTSFAGFNGAIVFKNMKN